MQTYRGGGEGGGEGIIEEIDRILLLLDRGPHAIDVIRDRKHLGSGSERSVR
jgi:hypothetical protein